MPTLPPLPQDIAKIAGPSLIGYLLHWGLFGALSVQVYIYYLAFPNDLLNTKTLVYTVYAVELIQTILFSKKEFQQYAAGFGSFQALDDGGLCWFAVPVLSSVVAFIVQIFYAYRINILAESYLIPIAIVLFALTQLGGGFAVAVMAKQIPYFSHFVARKTLIATGVWNGGSAICDVIIAASMTYYLSRRRTTWKPTQRTVQKLTRLIIETGTLTAVIAIINLILSMIPSHPTYYQTTSAIVGKLYSNTMMAVLNNRIVFSTHESSPNDLSSLVLNQENSRRPVFSNLHGGITVTREQWTAVPLEVSKIHDTKELQVKSDNVRVVETVNL